MRVDALHAKSMFAKFALLQFEQSLDGLKITGAKKRIFFLSFFLQLEHIIMFVYKCICNVFLH